MSNAARRPTGRHHGDLRNALEDAALQLVAEKGPKGFSLAEVTRRAGVSVAAPYKHFADRDALLASLAERGYVEQHRLFAAAIATRLEPVEQMVAFAGAYVRFAVEQKPLFEIVFRSGLNKYLYPHLGAAGDRVLKVLQEPARRLRSDDASAMELIYSVAASAHGYASFLLDGVFSESGESLDATALRAENAARQLAAGGMRIPPLTRPGAG